MRAQIARAERNYRVRQGRSILRIDAGSQAQRRSTASAAEPPTPSRRYSAADCRQAAANAARRRVESA
jgi:hypothetical protein